MRLTSPWIPAGLLVAGCLLNASVRLQRAMPLAAPLTTLPDTLAGLAGTDVEVTEAEIAAAGVSNFVFRTYQDPAAEDPAFSLYVGYYPEQRQGQTIHSPKNCLPGAGWEALESEPLTVDRPGGLSPVKINRFLVANREERAVVYYWYQGRGRTESNEYRVKLDLIKDAAISRRTEEALVRIVVPVEGDQDDQGADALGFDLVRRVSSDLERILPS